MARSSNSAVVFRQEADNVDAYDQEIDRLKDLIKEEKEKRKTALRTIHYATGFPPKISYPLILERRMDPSDRESLAAMMQRGRAILGTLDGTPLGEAARRPPEPRPSDTRIEDPDQEPLPDTDEPARPPAGPTVEELADCQAEGQSAAEADLPLSANPYEADEALKRAAWDTGWCRTKGTDGMDIPEEYLPKRKKGDPDLLGEERPDET